MPLSSQQTNINSTTPFSPKKLKSDSPSAIGMEHPPTPIAKNSNDLNDSISVSNKFTKGELYPTKQ